MLTPDEGFLDRRIAQEAVSLAGSGWSVDIEPTADPFLVFDGDLPASVRLRSVPGPRPARGIGRRALRAARRVVSHAAPPIDRLVEAARYRSSDRAGAMADAHVERLAAAEPFHLIVAHDAPVFPLAVRLKRRWACHLICDLHEIFAEQDEHFTTDTARSYWRSVERVGLAEADGILCVNAAVADYARATHAPPADCVIVHNSVPFVEATTLRGQSRGPSLRDLYPIPPGARIMLFAGSLRPHTNLAALIEGFGRAALDGWVLALLGEGPLRPQLERLVERRGWETRVFLGRRASQRELIAVASSADVGLLPYQPVGINHAVATPNKLFEYIQARLPIATSRLPMVERIVEAHGNGEYVDFASAESTAEGLRRFVAGPLDRIGQPELEAAARKFSWETDERSLLALVERVMTSGPPHRR
jgi:glycosyltransferase involved in cell wall biosynthesis